MAFCNRVVREAKDCQFNGSATGCNADITAIQDQIIIGMLDAHIREEALMKSWDLQSLRLNGMKTESATKSALEISGDIASVNKIGGIR